MTVVLSVTMVVISAMPMMVIRMSFLRMAPVPMVIRVFLPFVSVVVIMSMSMTVSIIMPVMVVVIAMAVSFVMTARMSVPLVMAMCTAMSLVMTMTMSMSMSMPTAVPTSVSMAVPMVVVVAVMTRNIVVRDSCILVKGCNDRVAYFLHVLLLVLVLLLAGQLVLPDPLEGLVTLVQDGLLLVADLGLVQLRVLHPRLEVKAVSLKTQLSFQALRLLLVVFLELLSVLHHLLNLVLGQPALVVGDGDLRLLAGRLVQGAHVQDPVGVDIKRDLNLRFSSRSWLDTAELKVA